jgi:hypothetical protein
MKAIYTGRSHKRIIDIPTGDPEQPLQVVFEPGQAVDIDSDQQAWLVENAPGEFYISGSARDELVAQANESGVNVNQRWSDETLAKKTQEAQARIDADNTHTEG